MVSHSFLTFDWQIFGALSLKAFPLITKSNACLAFDTDILLNRLNQFVVISGSASYLPDSYYWQLTSNSNFAMWRPPGLSSGSHVIFNKDAAPWTIIRWSSYHFFCRCPAVLFWYYLSLLYFIGFFAFVLVFQWIRALCDLSMKGAVKGRFACW